MITMSDGRFRAWAGASAARGGGSIGCGARASLRARARTRALALAGASFVALALLPLGTEAQLSPAASPFLAADHWSHGALSRLHGAGLLPEGHYDPGSRSVTRLEAMRGFERAAEAAVERSPEWAPRARAYRDRLAEEFPHTARRIHAAAAGAEGSVMGGVRVRRNELLARHEPEAGAESRPVPLGDMDRAVGGVEIGLDAPLGPLTFAAHVGGAAEGGQVRASEAYGVLVWGSAGLWAGRRHVGFGASDGGSVTLGHGVSFDGAGLFLADAVRLPGVLTHLGALGLETFLSRIARTGSVESPWFLGIRGSIAPHPRLRLGLTRGVFFAGESELVPDPTFDRLLKVVVGIDTADPPPENFENHTASADLWFAPPLGALPLVLYGEWGVQDLTAQRTEMPAFVFGTRVEGFPGATWLRIGVERATFSQPFASRRPWYDHRVFGTWTDGGTALGHPLGGVGRESRIYAGVDPLDARLRLEARGFRRWRGEGNLFAPERLGSSRGFEATARWRLAAPLEIELGGALERGDDWRAGASFLGGRLHF